ncbi:LuxR family transcriptional regulator, partial [Vibrio parahaemolyticus]|nr:LuxR family transcriptional regulator [Vibrio parahaemolyticus]
MIGHERQGITLTDSMYHQLLAQHDIYFVAFDNMEQIVASNYPVATLTLQCLDDLVFLVGPTHSAQIRAFLRHQRETLTFDVANLHFSMCILSDAGHALIYCLQIEAK